MTSKYLSRGFRALTLIGALGAGLAASACNNDNTSTNPITGANGDRIYTQIERLGNPLTSEVFFPKRDHGLHNTKGPADDGKTMDNGGTDVPGHIRTFVSSFPSRTEKTITTLQAVLTPDELLVFPNRAANTSGWLTWALANGYGGRNLSDDVVDAGLSAVFGNLLDSTQPVLAGLTSDNVPSSVRSFSTSFPYLEAPK